MPWKIVNLNYDARRPHLHQRDPREAIHMRVYLDGSGDVEICVGEDIHNPDACPVRAVVTAETCVVNATRFQRFHFDVLVNILASLDVAGADRDDALGWMSASIARGPHGSWYEGNVASHPVESAWPGDLTDDALIETCRDSVGVSKSRFLTLSNEMRRRGLEPPHPTRNFGRPVRKETT